MRPDVIAEGAAESAFAAGDGQGVDECRRGDERGVEAQLNGAVREGNGQVRFSAARLAVEDERSAFGHEVGRQERAHGGEPQGRLEGEVEFVDRLEEGELGGTRGAAQARSLAVGDLLFDEHPQESFVAELLVLGAGDEVTPDAARVGEMQSFEEQVE